ncbi:alkaline ceramidase 1 isoform X1 [Coturnix japonica]|uniref:alkaline ceramidase 1 isoform X1 n=1 Tax=Coturnix japonica TaxID=93934 RepID=UPI0007780A0B|nr:alkaline ceramidase 1 isoform X1 [Coturnix japonica]
MPRRRSPRVHSGDMAGGGSERGRDLGRDLHVKGPSEPYCCSVSPNRGPAPAAGTAALQPFPLHSSMPGSGIAMAVGESSSGLRSKLYSGPNRGFSKAVLEKHQIYPGFPTRTSAEPEDSYMQTDRRCWNVASSLRLWPAPSFTCCTMNLGGIDTHSQFCHPFRKQFYWLGGVTTVITTLMSFIKPSINAYALNCIAFHLLYLTWRELKKCDDQRVHRMAKAMVLWWVLAITSWLSDRWLCWLCQAINFPYFHSFWHVLIAVSLLYCFPLVMYFDVTYEMPAFTPKLGYWPSDSWPIVVPYIALEEPHKQC